MRIERQLKRKHSPKKKARTTTPNFKGRRHIVDICGVAGEHKQEPAHFGILLDLKQSAKKRR